MKIFGLYYDQDTGAREEWNIFYTPLKLFSTVEKRNEFIREFKANKETKNYIIELIELDIDDMSYNIDEGY